MRKRTEKTILVGVGIGIPGAAIAELDRLKRGGTRSAVIIKALTEWARDHGHKRLLAALES